MILRAFAKVNTFLAVGKADATGYHPIRSIFQEISLADELTIERSIAPSDSITFSGAGIPAVNTVSKALKAVRTIAAVPPLQIHVQKHIPSEAGLGGGSSDAAAVLKWCIQEFSPGVALSQQIELARNVGADVPFFLIGGRATATGYGEKLTPISPSTRLPFLIVVPNIGCSTPEMYRRLDSLDFSWRDFPESDALYNDFERVAPCECIDWIERLQALGATDAGLSGSGSAVFGRFSTLDACQGAYAEVSGVRKFVAEPVLRQTELE